MTRAHCCLQGQAQAPPPEPPGLHMLAKTVLPPSVQTRAASGNFSGAATGGTACNQHGGDGSGAAASGPGPTEVVLATATSLLLISVAAPMPEAALASAAAASAAAARVLADAMVDQDMAPAAGDSEDGDEADGGTAAHQVLCEQTAFGAVVAIATFRHPNPAETQVSPASWATAVCIYHEVEFELHCLTVPLDPQDGSLTRGNMVMFNISPVAQDPAQDLLLLLLAHNPQLLALRFDRECAR